MNQREHEPNQDPLGAYRAFINTLDMSGIDEDGPPPPAEEEPPLEDSLRETTVTIAEWVAAHRDEISQPIQDVTRRIVLFYANLEELPFVERIIGSWWQEQKAFHLTILTNKNSDVMSSPMNPFQESSLVIQAYGKSKCEAAPVRFSLLPGAIVRGTSEQIVAKVARLLPHQPRLEYLGTLMPLRS